jgi:hypothetical protein
MISAPGAPYIGKGRWAMPHFLIHDDKFMDKASEEVYEMERTMNEGRTATNNAQVKFKALKDTIIKAAQARVKTTIGKSEQKKKALQDERAELLNKVKETRAPTGQQRTSQHSCTAEAPPAPEGEEESVGNTSTQCHKCGEQQTAEKVAQIQKRIDELIDEQNERKHMECQRKSAGGIACIDLEVTRKSNNLCLSRNVDVLLQTHKGHVMYTKVHYAVST